MESIITDQKGKKTKKISTPQSFTNHFDKKMNKNKLLAARDRTKRKLLLRLDQSVCIKQSLSDADSKFKRKH